MLELALMPKSEKGIFGFGFSKLIDGGIFLFSIAMTALMTPASPLEASVCPMLVLEPCRQRCPYSIKVDRLVRFLS